MVATPRPFSKGDIKILSIIVDKGHEGLFSARAVEDALPKASPYRVDVPRIIARAKRRGWIVSRRTANVSGEGRGGWAWKVTGPKSMAEMKAIIQGAG